MKVCLTALRGPWGWTVFGLIWGFAVLGTILSAIWIKAPRALTTTIYIMMGWTVLIALYPLINAFKQANLLYSLWWLVTGGVLYTIGGIIYGLKIPKKKLGKWGFHEIFHVFIMLGSSCHYWFIFYIIY